MLNMQQYTNVLKTLWFDKVTVERLVSTVDTTTGVTETEEWNVVISDMDCRISYAMTDNPSEPYTANGVDRQLKFFTYYNLDIQAGDRCIITRVDRDGVTPLRTYQGLVGESNLYRGHKEILLNNVVYVTEGNY